jgi:hypothetical protein
MRQKKGSRAAAREEAGATAREMASVADAPLLEALVPAKLFEMGIGNLVFSRSLPDGRIAQSVFLLDIYCLGVKNAFFRIASRDEYAQRLRRWPPNETLQPMQPECFRKLVEGGVAYAQELGFAPHEDYEVAHQIFGDVQASACPKHFEYGHKGKPLYVSGPNETAAQVRNIMAQLERRRGPGNFDYVISAE